MTGGQGRSSVALRRVGTSLSFLQPPLPGRSQLSALQIPELPPGPQAPRTLSPGAGDPRAWVGPLLPTAPTPGGRGERRGGRPAQRCLQRKGRWAQPMVRPKPHKNLFLRWFRKAQRDSVRGRGGSFFSSVAPTIQLLFTEPVGQGWAETG